MAGCGAPDPVPPALLSKAARAVGAGPDVALSARSGGRGAGPTVPEALMLLRRAKVDRVVVASTHLVAGEVHSRCALDVARASALFPELLLVPPLLSGERDVRAVAAALGEVLPPRPGRALMLAGHAGAAASLAHLSLEHALWVAGRTDALVGDPRSLARAALPEDVREVLLAPLSMGLGVHAHRDFLGGLRSDLEGRGLTVEAREACLLDLPAVRELLLAHVREARPLPGARPSGPVTGGFAPAGSGRMGPVPAALGSASAVPGPARFPLFVDLAGAPCLVVGCGTVGSRRARALLAHGARVNVVDSRGCAPEGARRLVRAYEPGDEEGMRLVVAATDDRSVNELVAGRCRDAGIMVCVADAPAEGSFVFPALCETDRLVAGVVSRTGEHSLVAAAAAVTRDDIGWAEGAWEALA